MKNKLKNLAKDLKSLSIAISELSRGNMVVQASYTVETIKNNK